VDQDLWAHPVAVLAIPAFVPVVGIVATILWVARKDRLAAAAEAAAADADTVPSTSNTVPSTSNTVPSTSNTVPAASVVVEEAEPAEPRRSWRDRMPRLVIGDED
jgi:hypothetical protein